MWILREVSVSQLSLRTTVLHTISYSYSLVVDVEVLEVVLVVTVELTEQLDDVGLLRQYMVLLPLMQYCDRGL